MPLDVANPDGSVLVVPELWHTHAVNPLILDSSDGGTLETLSVPYEAGITDGVAPGAALTLSMAFSPGVAVGLSVTLNGLSSNGQYSDFALVGDHGSIGLIVNGGAPDALAWGSSAFGSEFGTGAAPTDYSGADTDDPDAPGLLYYSGTKDGDSFSGSVPIRAALPVNNVAPAIQNDDPTGTDLGDTITMTAGTWTGAAIVVQRLYSAGELLDEGASASHVITAAEDNEAITGEEEAVSSGGRITEAATGGFTVDDFEVPNISGVPTTSGTLEVGQSLTLTPASVTGDPSPVRTWQRYHDATPQGAAFSGSSYVLLQADKDAQDGGASITFRQIETNALGFDTADTAALGAISASSTPTTNFSRNYTSDTGGEVIDLSAIGPAEDGAASYTVVGGPITGVSVASSDATIDTDTVSAGAITFQRTDNSGVRNLVLTLTLTDLAVTSGDGGVSFSVEFGDDTRGTVEFSFDDGDGAATVTVAELNALADGEAHNGRAPLVFLVTDSDVDGQADDGDIIGREQVGIWFYPDTHVTTPTITWAVYDNGVKVGTDDTNYTVQSGDTGPFDVRETDGTTTVASDDAAIVYDGPGGFDPADLFQAGDDGFMLWPGSTGTELYQTDNETTPVTAGGQTVGLIKSLVGDNAPVSFSGPFDTAYYADYVEEGSGARRGVFRDLSENTIFYSLTGTLPLSPAVFLAGRCDGAGSASRQNIIETDSASGTGGIHVRINTTATPGLVLQFYTSGGWVSLGTELDTGLDASDAGAPFTLCLDGPVSGNAYLNNVLDAAYTNLRSGGSINNLLPNSDPMNGGLSVLVLRDRAFTSGERAAMHAAALALVPTADLAA